MWTNYRKRGNIMKKVIGILLVLFVTGMVFGADSELTLEARVTSSHGLLLSIDPIISIPDFNQAPGGVEVLDFGDLDIEGPGFTASLTRSFYIAFKRNDRSGTSISLSGKPLASSNESDPKIGYTIETEKNTDYYNPAEGGKLIVSNDDVSDITQTVGTFEGRNGMKVDSAEAIVTLNQNDVVHAAAETTYSTTITVGIVSNT